MVPTPAVSLREVSKTFGRSRVLTDVDLDLYPGEVHGLVGQNGSGKSTLIKILSGYLAPDAGSRLTVQGEDLALPLPPGSPIEHGLSFVHQHPALVDELSVAENLWLGRYDCAAGWRIRTGQMRRETREVAARFGLDIDPDEEVGALTAAHKALLAIARAVIDVEDKPGATIVLDEPTARLDRDGVELLFGAIRGATARGTAILFVSHRLEEVLTITDRVTALRGGRVVGAVATSKTDEEGLIRLIVGAKLGALYPEPAKPRTDPVFTTDGLSGHVVRNLKFEVHAGEIVGITGLPGTGFDELPYLLMDPAGEVRGRCRVGSTTLDLETADVRERMKAGIAFVPGDRSRQGAAPDLSAAENVTLLRLSDFVRKGVLRPKRERAAAQEALQLLQVRPDNPELPFRLFSGGNQQKTVLAKWLWRDPQLLILHEPTQGVDIEARKQIFRLIGDLAAKGTAIMLASIEYEDLAHLCHRVVVLRDGAIATSLVGEGLTADTILEECYRSQRSTEVHVG